MVLIRRARLADIPVLQKLEQEFHRDERTIVLKDNPQWKHYVKRRPDRDRTVARWLRNWILSRNALVLIACADDISVGFLTASIEIDKGIMQPKRLGFIGFVFVRRPFRGQGISTLMMRETLAWFAKRKVKNVCLTVIADNKPARAIWKRWGFVDFSVFAWKVD
jgi:GNAT superfamily N-acetyltransferase